jgi:hypothetical protein
MRVNISYSAELDEVPAELSRIIVDTTRRLSTQAATLSQAEELLTKEDAVENAAIVAELLDAARQELASVDTRLSESISILGGYYQAKTNPESLTAPSVEDTTDALIEQAEELSAQLSESREELEEIISETDNGVATPSEDMTTAEAASDSL